METPKVYIVTNFREAEAALGAVGYFLNEKGAIIGEQHGEEYEKRVKRCIVYLMDVCKHTYEQQTLEVLQKAANDMVEVQ